MMEAGIPALINAGQKLSEDIAQRLARSLAEAKREAEQHACFDDILRGAIVGAPAVEDD